MDLNADGSSRDNSGRVGVGGHIRASGDFVYQELVVYVYIFFKLILQILKLVYGPT